MRLTDTQRQAIITTAKAVFGSDTGVILFGSRTDDSLRGGDIDLMISTDLDRRNARRRKLTFLARLKREIGDRRIDVVLRTPDTETLAIHEKAEQEGVRIS